MLGFFWSILLEIHRQQTLCLSDLNRILGYELQPFQGVLVVKMLRQIWNIRWKGVFNDSKNPSDIDIIFQFKLNLKRFLTLERGRMNCEKLKSVYVRNNYLCFIKEKNQLEFNY